MTRLNMPNRRIRGRMYGGVGGEVSNGLPYPIHAWGRAGSVNCRPYFSSRAELLIDAACMSGTDSITVPGDGTPALRPVASGIRNVE